MSKKSREAKEFINRIHNGENPLLDNRNIELDDCNARYSYKFRRIDQFEETAKNLKGSTNEIQICYSTKCHKVIKLEIRDVIEFYNWLTEEINE